MSTKHTHTHTYHAYMPHMLLIAMVERSQQNYVENIIAAGERDYSEESFKTNMSNIASAALDWATFGRLGVEDA